MKVLIYDVGVSVAARLVDHDITVYAPDIQEVMLALQYAMAQRAIHCHSEGIEHVWPLDTVPESLERWNEGQPVFYRKEQYVFDGKLIELPNLSVRVWESE